MWNGKYSAYSFNRFFFKNLISMFCWYLQSVKTIFVMKKNLYSLRWFNSFSILFIIIMFFHESNILDINLKLFFFSLLFYIAFKHFLIVENCITFMWKRKYSVYLFDWIIIIINMYFSDICNELKQYLS